MTFMNRFRKKIKQVVITIVWLLTIYAVVALLYKSIRAEILYDDYCKSIGYQDVAAYAEGIYCVREERHLIGELYVPE